MQSKTKKTPEHWQTKVEVLVPFYDVDSMEIAWHGNYVKYFEVARCKLLDGIQSNYIQMREAGYGWPIVDIRLKYVRPARFNQRINVFAEIVEWEMRLKIKYLITDVETGEVLTRGYSIQVAVDIHTHEMNFVTPDVFQKNLHKKPEPNS